jgi:hypothetical protein
MSNPNWGVRTEGNSGVEIWECPLGFGIWECVGIWDLELGI